MQQLKDRGAFTPDRQALLIESLTLTSPRAHLSGYITTGAHDEIPETPDLLDTNACTGKAWLPGVRRLPRSMPVRRTIVTIPLYAIRS